MFFLQNTNLPKDQDDPHHIDIDYVEYDREMADDSDDTDAKDLGANDDDDDCDDHDDDGDHDDDEAVIGSSE